MILGVPQITCRHGPEIAGDVNVGGRCLFKPAAFDEAHRRIDNGLCGQAMDAAGYQPENIAR